MTAEEAAEIRENIERLKKNAADAAVRSGRRPEDIRIVLATKTQPPEKINHALRCGITEIGENRVQELLDKYDAIDRDGINIHFIGTLQTNKVKYIIDKVSLIHSVNSEKLAAEIDRQAAKHGIVSDILIEVNAADEASKTGVRREELERLLAFVSTLSHVRVRGLMAIPPANLRRELGSETAKKGEIVNNLQTIADSKRYFEEIVKIFLDISKKKSDNISMEILSLGMSGDYIEAIEAGSTMIRPGRAIFGERTKVLPTE